jgi:hypothetical protein
MKVKMVPIKGRNLIIYSGHISKALDHKHPHWVNLAERYGSSFGITSTVALGEHIWIVELRKIEGIEGISHERPHFRASYKTSSGQEDFVVFPSSETAKAIRNLQFQGICWLQLSTDYSEVFLSTKRSDNRPPRSLHRAIVRLFEVWRSLTIEQVFKGLCCESPAKRLEVLRLLESGEVRGVNLIDGRWAVMDDQASPSQKGLRFKPFSKGMKGLWLKPFTPEAIARIKARAHQLNGNAATPKA